MTQIKSLGKVNPSYLVYNFYAFTQAFLSAPV